MSKQKSKTQTPLRSNSRKTGGRSSPARTTARKATKFKAGAQSAVSERQQAPAEQTGRPDSKQARIIAMLRAASGATIQAMAHAMGWKQHSVRGFLAAVVRDPFSRRICCDVDPDQVSAAQMDDEEGIEQVEANGLDNEQIHGGDVRRVIAQCSRRRGGARLKAILS